ncbi:HEAT repeat domain-containing protein [Streptomyces sp. NPDC029216]|uniref:HEAT repeat domain-containing protein n=1 Tax=Streptomyces sp. NPDC029216 TaxID=3154701 RepID=UPI00340F763B
MIYELDGVDWASMRHAYGPAGDVPRWIRGMASADPDARQEAFDEFHSAAHHQGDVYPVTVAALPFLFDLADDPATPDRDDDCIRFSPDGTESTAPADAMALLRARADAFVRYAADPDPGVRRPGTEGVGLFLDDADRAVRILRDRLPAESGTAERLLVIRTMATLALRLPAARTTATAWLDTLADDPSADPDIRLGALVHRARCTPQDIGDEVIPTAIGLLGRLTPGAEEPDDRECGAGSGACACTEPEPAAARDVPPQIAAAFEDLDRHGRAHAPTTTLLQTFHTVLDARVPERTALLTAQLRSPDPATRHDAIAMAKDLIGSWRGDHTRLVTLLADRLQPQEPYTTTAAAECLRSLGPLAEPAREALAACVAAHRTAHGEDVWAAPRPLLRRAHQEAVMALAHLGDPRALPSLLTALDSGVDAWRAVQVAGRLGPAAAGELVPRLTRHLAGVDFSQEWTDMSAGALVGALAALGDPAAVPAITRAVEEAARHEQGRTAASALEALSSFGTAAAGSLEVVRRLADAQDADVRLAAAGALWALGRDPEDVLPRLEEHLDGYRRHQAAQVLGRIGPPAGTAVPSLGEMLTSGDAWTRVHAATALWDIAGETGPDADAEADAGAVVRTLLAAWEDNNLTSHRALACLSRMGPAAAPAVPRIEAELAAARRHNAFFGSIADDEETLHLCRTVLERLAADPA